MRVDACSKTSNNIIIITISTNKILYKTERGKFTSNYLTKGTWCKIKILLNFFFKKNFSRLKKIYNNPFKFLCDFIIFFMFGWKEREGKKRVV